MYTVTTEAEFDAAHFLAGYQGKCRNIHGHRWRVVVRAGAETLGPGGMVMDFKDLKKSLRDLTEYFDHCLIAEKGTLKPALKEALSAEEFRVAEVDFRPTAEQFARYFYEEMKKKGCPVREVQVYETPENCGGYGE